MRRTKHVVAITFLAAGLVSTGAATAQNMDSDRSSNGGLRVGTGSGSILRDNSSNAGTEGGTVGQAYEGAVGRSGPNDRDAPGHQRGGFPVGILGLAGLAGLANLFRRREVTHDTPVETPTRRRAVS